MVVEELHCLRLKCFKKRGPCAGPC
jgi:hypothetical protein